MVVREEWGKCCGAKLRVIYDPDADQLIYAAVSAAKANDITVAQRMPKDRHGDHTNAVLSAVGHNLRLVLNWLRLLLRLFLFAIFAALTPRSALKPAS